MKFYGEMSKYKPFEVTGVMYEPMDNGSKFGYIVNGILQEYKKKR